MQSNYRYPFIRIYCKNGCAILSRHRRYFMNNLFLVIIYILDGCYFEQSPLHHRIPFLKTCHSIVLSLRISINSQATLFDVFHVRDQRNKVGHFDSSSEFEDGKVVWSGGVEAIGARVVVTLYFFGILEASGLFGVEKNLFVLFSGGHIKDYVSHC